MAILPSHNEDGGKDLFLRHLGLIKLAEKERDETKSEAATARKALSDARKAAKRDGVDLEEMDAAITDSKRSAEEVIAKHNTRIRYWRFMRLPAGAQASLLDEMPSGEKSEAELLDHAEGEGARAFLRGDDLEKSNPHGADTAAWQRYVTGYNNARDETIRAMTPVEGADQGEQGEAGDQSGEEPAQGSGKSKRSKKK